MIMAIGYWIAFIIFAVCGGLLAAVSYYEQKNIPSLILSMILTIVICGGVWWYGANTESGRRSLKDQQSNFGHGIDRIVTIYDFQGKVIKQYSGKFDVETGDDRKAKYILFDDEAGKRHMIYYTTGTIIIDER